MKKMSEDNRYFLRIYLWCIFWIVIAFVIFLPMAFASAPAQ